MIDSGAVLRRHRSRPSTNISPLKSRAIYRPAQSCNGAIGPAARSSIHLQTGWGKSENNPAGGDRCFTRPIGRLPALTPILMTLALRRSPGNFCDAIPNISRRIDLLLAKPRPARNFPNRSPSAGGCDFAVDPSLRADRACVVSLPHLNPAAVIVAPAPAKFSQANPIGELSPKFSRRAIDGEYWIVEHVSSSASGERTRGPPTTVTFSNTVCPFRRTTRRSASEVVLW